MSVIIRQIWVTQRLRIQPIDVVYGSQVGISLQLMDYDIPANAVVKAYARGKNTAITYVSNCTFSGNTVSFSPPDGFFIPGLNLLQIEINGAIIPFSVNVNCEKRISELGDTAPPEQIRPLVERAVTAAAEAETASNNASRSATEASGSANAAKFSETNAKASEAAAQNAASAADQSQKVVEEIKEGLEADYPAVPELNAQVAGMEKSLIQNNGFNIAAAYGSFEDKTYRGITFAWNEDHTQCTVNGTSTEPSANNIINSQDALPYGIEANSKLYFDVNTTTADAYIRATFFDESGNAINSDVVKTPTWITVPDATAKITVRVQIKTGATVENDVVSVKIYKNLPNSLLEGKVNELQTGTAQLLERLKSGKIEDAELHLGWYLDSDGKLYPKERGINMGSQSITGLATPTEDADAANKGYVDARIADANAYSAGLHVRNLLDNSDFTDPVAQAGIGGSHGNQRYVCDRWFNEYGWGAFEKVTDGIRMSYQDGHCYMTQRLHPNMVAYLNGKNITVAVCLTGGKVVAGHGNFDSSKGSIHIEYENLVISVYENLVRITVLSGSATIHWAALYEGAYTAETLPPYVSKGYGVELAECLRYFERIGDARSETLGGAVYVRTGASAYMYTLQFLPKRVIAPSVILSDTQNYRILLRDLANANAFGAIGVSSINVDCITSPFLVLKITGKSNFEYDCSAMLQREDNTTAAYIDVSADL